MILGSPISGSHRISLSWNHHPKAGPSASSNGFLSVQRLQSTHWPCERRYERRDERRYAQRSGGRCSWDRNSEWFCLRENFQETMVFTIKYDKYGVFL